MTEIVPLVLGEPVAWQYRVMFDLGHAREKEWCKWRYCSEKYFTHIADEIAAGATRVQTRALYASPLPQPDTAPSPLSTGEAKTLKQIAAFNITPSTGASVAMAMRRIAEEALSQPPAKEQIRREVMSDVEIAAWGRDWHWADTAENKPTDPSIYFRDTRMLKAFARAMEYLAGIPKKPV